MAVGTVLFLVLLEGFVEGCVCMCAGQSSGLCGSSSSCVALMIAVLNSVLFGGLCSTEVSPLLVMQRRQDWIRFNPFGALEYSRRFCRRKPQAQLSLTWGHGPCAGKGIPAEKRGGCVHSTRQEEAFITPIAFLQHEGFTLANDSHEARENATYIYI